MTIKTITLDSDLVLETLLALRERKRTLNVELAHEYVAVREIAHRQLMRVEEAIAILNDAVGE